MKVLPTMQNIAWFWDLLIKELIDETYGLYLPFLALRR